jgi:hypothetical protein
MWRGWRIHRASCDVCDSGRAAIGAGSKIMQVVEVVIMALARHAAILQPNAAHMPHNGMYAPPAKSGRSYEG